MAALGLETVGLEDPRLADEARPFFGIPLGAKESTWQQIPSNNYPTTSISQSFQLQYNVPPSSPTTYVDSIVEQYWDITLTFAGTNTTGSPGLLHIGTDDGPRMWPIAAAIGPQTIKMDLNNCSITQQMDCYDALTHYVEMHEPRNRRLSTTPSMPDQYQNYGDWRIYGSGRNPLALLGENAYDDPRGSFPGMTVLTNNPTAATVRLRVLEPFFMSPLEQYQVKPAFVGIQNWAFYITVNNIARMWSHDPTNGNTITSITAQFNAQPQLRFRFLNKYDYIPRPRLYPFNDIPLRNVFQIGTVNAGQTVSVLMNTFTVDTIPRRCYIFARPDNSVLSAIPTGSGGGGQNFTNTFMGINSITMQWGTKTGIFSTAQPQDLYHMSCDCGLARSWTEFSVTQGAVVSFIPGVHFPLTDIEDAAGTQKQNQVTVTVSFTNLNQTQNINYTAYFIGITSGAFVINDLQAERTNSVITGADVMKFRRGGGRIIPLSMSERLNGMGFWDNLKSFVRDNVVSPAAAGLRGLSNVASKVSGYASRIGDVFGDAQKDLGGGRMRMIRPRMFGRGFIDDSRDSQAPGLKRSRVAEGRLALAAPRSEECDDVIMTLP